MITSNKQHHMVLWCCLFGVANDDAYDDAYDDDDCYVKQASAAYQQ